jgi:cytochrome c2
MRPHALPRLVLLLLLAGACGRASADQRRSAGIGDPERGRGAIARDGCGSCHLVPGVRDAVGLVGPPLLHWSRRGYIAGRLPNTPDDLVRWIVAPQAIEPGTAMPTLGIPVDEARDIAAYLYTLR